MTNNDITLNKIDDFKIGFGGGCMILECLKCGKDISIKEVAFPGTKEQQKPILEYFKKIKQIHKCSELLDNANPQA